MILLKSPGCKIAGLFTVKSSVSYLGHCCADRYCIKRGVILTGSILYRAMPRAATYSNTSRYNIHPPYVLNQTRARHLLPLF